MCLGTGKDYADGGIMGYSLTFSLLKNLINGIVKKQYTRQKLLEIPR